MSGKEKTTQSRLETLPPIVLASFSTAVLMFPVDVIRALRMGSAGTDATLIQSFSRFVKLYGYKGLVSQGIWGKPSTQGTPLQKLIAGALSVIPEAFTITPMEATKAALQLDKTNHFKNSSKEVVKTLRQTYGLRGLTIGYLGLQIRQSCWTGTYFATLSTFSNSTKQTLAPVLGTDSRWLSPLSSVCGGFLAGILGAIPNVPADVVRTRVQKTTFEMILAGTPRPAPSVIAVSDHAAAAREIIAKSGVKGLYSGFTWKALHLGGSGALMAVFVPYFTKILFKKKDLEEGKTS